jgi:YD repeat-containing protein
MSPLHRSGLWFALFVMLFATACTTGKANETSPAPQYFTTLPFRETPFDPMVGIYPMSAEDARSRNHYRFEYDARGRPVRVSYRLGSRVRDILEAPNYYFSAPIVEIAYGESRETHSFFDKHGNRIVIEGGVFAEVYDLDARGYRRALHFLDVEGAPPSTAGAWRALNGRCAATAL